MKKRNSVQKKKTAANTILNFLFKTLVLVAVLIFGYIIFDKSNFATSSMSMGSIKRSAPSADVPAELRWSDSFRGIENVPDKNQKKEKQQSSSGGGSSTGFKFQGFGK